MKKELDAAKKMFREEFFYNLYYLSCIYWEHNKAPGQEPRFIYYPPINTYQNYINIIIKYYPDLSGDIIWLFSVFNQVQKSKSIVLPPEYLYDYIQKGIKINNTINKELERFVKLDFSIP